MGRRLATFGDWVLRALSGLVHLSLQLAWGGLILLLLAAVWFQLPTGRTWLLARLVDEANRAQPDYTLSAGPLSAGWPFFIGLGRISVADHDGPLLDAEDVSLRWSPFDLLDGKLEVEALRAKSVTLHRYPAAPAHERGPAEAGALAGLKLGVRTVAVDALRIPDVPYTLTGEADLTGTFTAPVVALRVVQVKELNATLKGVINLGGDPALNGLFSYAVPDLAPAGKVLGLPLNGAVSGTLTLKGREIAATLDATDLRYADASARRLTLAVTLVPLPGPVPGPDSLSPVRSLTVSGKVDDLPLSLSTLLAPTAAGWNARDLRLNSPLLHAQGALEVDAKQGGLLQGTVKLKAPDLALLTRWVGKVSAAEPRPGPVAGWAAADLTFSAQRDQQDLRARLTAGLSRPLSLQADAKLSATRRGAKDPALALTLSSLSATIEKEKVVLRQPATLTVREGGRSATLTPLQVGFGPATLSLRGTKDAQRISAEAEVRALSFRQIPPLRQMQGKVTGTIGGKVTLDGSLSQPTLRATVEALPAFGKGTAENRLTATLTYAAGVTQLHGGYYHKGREELTATAKITHPLDLTRLSSPTISQWLNAPLSGRVQGEVDLASLQGRADVTLPLSRGVVKADVSVSGSLARPTAQGTASLSNSSFTSPVTGTALQDLAAQLAFTGQTITLSALSATDGRGGKLTGSGTLTLPGALALRATAERFLAVRLPEARVLASADLTLSGSSLSALTLAGAVEVEEATFRIPERLPVSLIRLPVVHVGGPRRQIPPSELTKGAPASPAPSSAPLQLEVSVNAPNQVYVEGRGLQSELAGRLMVRGTTAAPDVTGQLTLVRGSLDVLGKRLMLDTGRISFDGGSLTNPTVDVTATEASGEVEVRVALRGPVRAPVVTYESTPSLPQDEILSRLLFNQGAAALSPFQAIQLARAVASLSGVEGGGGFDPTRSLRRGLGLDQLDVVSDGSGDTGTALEGSALEAGKYLGDRVYLSTRQGLTPGSSKVGVDIRLTPSVSVKSETSLENTGNLSLEYRRDY